MAPKRANVRHTPHLDSTRAGSQGHNNNSDEHVVAAGPQAVSDQLDKLTENLSLGDHQEDLNNESLSDPEPWSAKDSIVNTYPLTSEQASMINSTLSEDSRLNSSYHAYSLPLDTNMELLKRSWEATLAKHDVLRTSFHETTGKGESWIGAVHKQPEVRWDNVDLCYIEPPDESAGAGKAAEKPAPEKDQAPTPAKKPIIPKSKRKTKSKKTAKYVDKRQAKNTDDFMEDPSLYESFDRKILSDNDYGRLNLDSGTFWDVPSAEEELRVELQRITSAVSYPDKSAFARPPVQITILRNEEEVVFVASLHDAVFAAPEKPPVESVFEDLWRTYHAEDPTSEQAATPFWLNRIKKYQAVKSASGEENEGEAEQEGGGEDMFM